jgi:hypothetical protein
MKTNMFSKREISILKNSIFSRVCGRGKFKAKAFLLQNTAAAAAAEII